MSKISKARLDLDCCRRGYFSNVPKGDKASDASSLGLTSLAAWLWTHRSNIFKMESTQKTIDSYNSIGRKINMTAWKIEGQYMETCNCAYVCPCITSNLSANPTEGDCKAAIAMKIDKGHKGDVNLDGLCFIVVLYSPGPMIDGNLKVGLIVDERADDAQTDAIAAIATGAEGGPMANLAPLVGEVAGIEKRAIDFSGEGLAFASRAGDLIDQAIEGVPSMADETVAVHLDNTGHPANSRLALAKAVRSVINVFGISWNDSTGSRNGHFAPFSWAA